MKIKSVAELRKLKAEKGKKLAAEMGISLKQFELASRATKLLTKEQLAQAIVETTPFAGWRTAKTLLKWHKKNVCPIVGFNKHKAQYQVTKAKKELRDFQAEKVNELLELTEDDLRSMLRMKSAKNLNRLYKVKIADALLPVTALKDGEERTIEIDKRAISNWKRQCARRKAKAAPTAKKAARTIRPAKRAKIKTKEQARQLTNDYVSAILSFNRGIAEQEKLTAKAARSYEKKSVVTAI